MQPLVHDPLDVAPLLVVDNAERRVPLARVEGHHELELRRLVADDPDRIDRNVRPRLCRHEPDQREPLLECPTQGDVLRVVWVLAPVLVAEQPVRPSATSYGGACPGAV